MWHERALPDLGRNIKCGNSLIGPDYYEAQQTSLFDDEEERRVNIFDWKAGFPRSEEHTSELQSLAYLVCRLLLEKKKKSNRQHLSFRIDAKTQYELSTSLKDYNLLRQSADSDDGCSVPARVECYAQHIRAHELTR